MTFNFILRLGVIAGCSSLLIACNPVNQSDFSELTEQGVSKQLSDFRKGVYHNVSYDLEFFLPEKKEKPVTGRVILNLTVSESEPLILDFKATPDQLKSVILNGDSVVYRFENEHIFIPASQVSAGKQQITLDFIAADQSLNRREDYMYTLLVPDRARTLFPCLDQPNMKSCFRLLLDFPEAWDAVSNSPVAHIDSISEKGRKRTIFSETEPLSTYLFSFVAGQLQKETFTRDNQSIVIYHRETDPQKQAQCPILASEVFDALKWMENYTGIPYPFAKYDLIILPGFQFGGMEHTGATLYNDTRMFLNENPTFNERMGRSALIAHETAHMWFGDFVTMDWFDDVWTKEVFANYFASRIVEPLYPKVNHRLNFMLDYLPASYAEDRTMGSNAIKQNLDNLRNAGLVYGNIIYDKSPVVMEMLTQLIGEKSFQAGIQRYLNTYAYGNATWEGLISIMDTYTDKDLKAWSEVWVNQKGMPTIRFVISNKKLCIRQSDPFQRGLIWPQSLSYLLIQDSRTDTISVSLDKERVDVKLSDAFDSEKPYLLLPNSDGRGYGFFEIDQADQISIYDYLLRSTDDVLKGSLLIILHENLLNGVLDPELYTASLLRYIQEENNPLLFSLALNHIASAQRQYPSDIRNVEDSLWELATTASASEFRLQALRTYRNLAETPDAILRLYNIWRDQQSVAGCTLAETDYIALSYKLAMQLPDKADEICKTQLSRIKNPDRIRQYTFICPAVSASMEVRDSVFSALQQPENRRVEPWAATALSYLNSYYRQEDAVKYIYPALDMMIEIQQTGDIFFPRSWVRSLLSGHTTETARIEVESFLEANPDYPVLLKNKILQQADHLFRK